MDYEQTMMDAK